MSFLRKTFDTLSEHEFRWAGTLFKLAFWWISAFIVLLVSFYAAFRMKGLLASIPAVIQFACLALICITILLMIGMFRERGRALHAYSRFLSLFAELNPALEKERATGLPHEKIAGLRRKAGSLPGKPREWWLAIEQSLEYYTSPAGNEGWFITRPVDELLPEEDVIDSFYHSSFHQSIPGILTAMGLLATFVAILMALAGVTYNINDPVRPVSGIDQLINGLSGKFVSSIVALILSVIFTFFEKKICDRQLQNGYDALIKRCRDVLPLLTQSRILLDIQRIALNQSRAAERSQA